MNEQDRQQAITKGRAIQDMTKMEGWSILRQELQAEIMAATEDARQIDVENLPLQDIAVEFVRLQKLIAGLQRTEQIINELLENMEQALNQ